MNVAPSSASVGRSWKNYALHSATSHKTRILMFHLNW